MTWALISVFCLGVNVGMLAVFTMTNVIIIKKRRNEK